MNLFEYIRREHRTDLLLEWDRERNGALEPLSLSIHSKEKCAWRCAKGHRWQASIASRVAQGSGCPYCAGQKPLPGERDLQTLRPDVAALWDSAKNGCGPESVLPMSHVSAHWRCERGHEWTAPVYALSSGCGCPYCAGNRAIPGETDLATTHPALAAEWDGEKNGAPASSVSAGSTKSAWWTCALGHSYRAAVYSRVAGCGCPYCAGKKVLPGFNDLASTDPELAKEWADERLAPTEVTRGSHQKAWWKCPLGHRYEAAIYSRAGGSDCPYCAGRKVLPGFNDLATTHPQIAAQWDAERNGELTPQMVTKGSNQKAWFRCGEGHVWQARIFSRTRAKAADCPACARGEKSRRVESYRRELPYARGTAPAPVRVPERPAV